MTPLLQVIGLGKRFGGFVALDGIDLDVAQGERVGLIGPNGSGKSTLVNCICGTLVNETGSVRFGGETVDGMLTHERTRRGMARSFQLPRPFVTLTVADNLRVPLLYTVNARAGSARNVLVVCQVALALVLLIGAGLLLRTFDRLRSVDLGVRTSNVLTFARWRCARRARRRGSGRPPPVRRSPSAGRTHRPVTARRPRRRPRARR